jgi:hypothetical protein
MRWGRSGHVSEERDKYLDELNMRLINGLLEIFTHEQLESIIADANVIFERGYGELTIIVDGDWLYLKPSPSKRIGRIKTTRKP